MFYIFFSFRIKFHSFLFHFPSIHIPFTFHSPGNPRPLSLFFQSVLESFPSHYRVILEPLSRDNLLLPPLHLVPLAWSFFISKRNNPPFHLVSFLSTLCLFYPKPLSKKTQPSVSITLIRVGPTIFVYFVSRSCVGHLPLFGR